MLRVKSESFEFKSNLSGFTWSLRGLTKIKALRTIGFGSGFGYPKLGLISKYQKRVKNQIWFSISY
jgi:hypothetical protein